MKIPNADKAVIAEDKLCNYLLNLAHRRGGSKAKLLHSMGYRPDDWQQLEADIRTNHLTAEVDCVADTEYGTRSEIVAPLHGPGGLTEVSRKLVQAAARTHLESGLTSAAHTGDGTAALDELKVLQEVGADGSAFIWVHAQNEKDAALHARAAEQGAWVEFDAIGPATVQRHVELVKSMRARGCLGRVLLSHDAGWYHVGEPGGGKFRPYDTLFTTFLPALKAAGFTDAEVRQLTVDSPREALTIRVRSRRPR